MKIRSVGAELFHAEGHGRTARHDEANSHFPQILRTRLKRLTELWKVNRDCSAVWGVGQKTFKRSIKKRDGKGLGVGGFIWLGTGTSNRLL